MWSSKTTKVYGVIDNENYNFPEKEYNGELENIRLDIENQINTLISKHNIAITMKNKELEKEIELQFIINLDESIF